MDAQFEDITETQICEFSPHPDAAGLHKGPILPSFRIIADTMSLSKTEANVVIALLLPGKIVHSILILEMGLKLSLVEMVVYDEAENGFEPGI